MAFTIENLKTKKSLTRFSRRFSKGELLFRQGQSGNTLFIILEGVIQLLLESEFGEHVFSIVSAGELLGEKSVLADSQRQRIFSAQALEPVLAIELNYQDLNQLQKEEPDLILDILRRSFEVSSKRLEQANYLARVLRGSDPRKRLLDCLVYLSRAASIKKGNSLKILKLNEALNYYLELDPNDRESFIRELIETGVLEAATEGDYLVLDEKKLSLLYTPAHSITVF